MNKKLVLLLSFLFALSVGIAFAASGPPVPGSWYREGPVTLGSALYFTDITAGITAFAGGGQQSTATTLTEVNQVTTVASANDSLTMSCAAAGRTRFITNAASANALKIYALSPGKINGVATGTGYTLAAGKSALCVAEVLTSTASACDWGCIGP